MLPSSFKSKISQKNKYKCKHCGKNMLSPGLRILGFLFYPLLAFVFVSDSMWSPISLGLIVVMSVAMSFVRRPKECLSCGEIDEDMSNHAQDTGEFDEEDNLNSSLRYVPFITIIAILFISVGIGFIYWFIDLL